MAEIQFINYGDVLEHYKAFGTFPTGFSPSNYKKTVRECIQHTAEQHPMDFYGLRGDRVSFKQEQRFWILNILNLAAEQLGFSESTSVMKITKGELYKAMCYLIIKSSGECSLSVRDVVEDLSEPLEILSIVEYENISLEQDK